MRTHAPGRRRQSRSTHGRHFTAGISSPATPTAYQASEQYLTAAHRGDDALRANAGGSAEQACGTRHATLQMQPAAEPKMQHVAKRSQGCGSRQLPHATADATRRDATHSERNSDERATSNGVCSSRVRSFGSAGCRQDANATRANHRDNSDSWRALPPADGGGGRRHRAAGNRHHARVCLPALTVRQARG